MEIYLDANATTPVLGEARAAALAAMAQAYGNPSSVHGTGLKARALMDSVREQARRAIGARNGQILFVSGATEGIQTAVLSAMTALRERGDLSVLYGATEHKAVPEAIPFKISFFKNFIDHTHFFSICCRNLIACHH